MLILAIGRIEGRGSGLQLEAWTSHIPIPRGKGAGSSFGLALGGRRLDVGGGTMVAMVLPID